MRACLRSQDPESYFITIDASMDVDLLHRALDATEAGAECTISTMYTAPMTPMPLMTMFERCLTVTTGQPHARTDMEPVLALIASGVYSPSSVVTDVVEWDRAHEAFLAGDGKWIVKRSRTT